jgi:SAM-dependent methyltransferase
MLMIGLSSGSWARVLAATPGLERFTIVEINPGYLGLIAAHPEVAGILHDPKVEIVVDDGRRWLESHPDETFDAIVMNMTWHWRAHATNLLSREFFELVKKHLTPGGLFYFNTTSSRDACMTAIAAFSHTLRVRNFLAGSDAPLSLEPIAWNALLTTYRIDGRLVIDMSTEEGQSTLASLMPYSQPGVSGDSPLGESNALLEDEANLRQTCAAGEVITDDNMLPEWRELVH